MNPKELPSLSLFRDSLPLQIRFSDVDVLGHVNNTVYMAFYDTGKANYMTRVLGRKITWKEVDTVIANIDCAFIEPIFFGDDVEVMTRCVGIHEKSFHLQQMIHDRKTGRIKSLCETVMVCFDRNSQKACAVSDEWRRKLQDFEGCPLVSKNVKES